MTTGLHLALLGGSLIGLGLSLSLLYHPVLSITVAPR